MSNEKKHIMINYKDEYLDLENDFIEIASLCKDEKISELIMETIIYHKQKIKLRDEYSYKIEQKITPR